MTNPSLQFTRGDQSGFTPAGLSGFQDIKSAAVVRELVQNSLDATKADEQAIVRFSLFTIPLGEIPAIADYRDAFGKSVECQSAWHKGKLPDQAQSVVERMGNSLGNETVEVLTIADNGIGLDEKRMSSLLSDGISYQKDSKSTGAYGNGHMVAIPSSNLRYVLYGGVVESGKMICSGHAVLASRASDNGAVLSKDGYYIAGFNDDFYDPYSFAKNMSDFPKLISDQLKSIKKEWGKGTVVIIPGFNRFLPKHPNKFDLWRSIAKAAATNFFCAIYRKKLVIETIVDGQTKRLDHNNIEEVLRGFKEELKATRPFLSGLKAFCAYSALKQDPNDVNTSKGQVSLHMNHPVKGKSRIDLCRNGMWITDSIPGYYGKFADRQQFHCVVCIDGDSILHRLIRKSEGPLHTEISLKRLKDNEATQLRRCLEEIREAILQQVPKLDLSAFFPDDILSVTGNPSGSGAGNVPSLLGLPTALTSSSHGGVKTGTGTRGGGGKGSKKKSKGRKKKTEGTDWSSRSLRFKGVALPTGSRSYKVRFIPLEDSHGSEIRFVLDECIDATSDNSSRASFVFIEDAKIQLNGKPIPSVAKVSDGNGKHIGVRIGPLQKDSVYTVEVQYGLPEELGIPKEKTPVLGVELKRRAPD